jgi:glucose-1-phosphate cytidylyltransferase
MKVAILAGGLGTRLAEETSVRPKPMVEIGGQPILWHICKHFAHFGHTEFCVALGYKGESIKQYFLEYRTLVGSMTVDLANGQVERHEDADDGWRVHLLDTGAETQTGGRIRRMRHVLAGGTFLATYGDGVSDVDLHALLAFHRSHGKLATLTAVRPPARFGGIDLDGDMVRTFTEKPQVGEGWINGGFFVFESAVLDWIEGDATSLEWGALTRLAAAGQLAAYRHHGFWQCMDNLREKRLLESLYASGEAPWVTWRAGGAR